jgi:uncharacterized membrane protein YheB (UPF0754 family)
MLSTVALYLAIPLTSALIGWGTNVLAIKMMFSPLEFVGRGIWGWQGIIPSRAEKMAGICVDMMTEKLLDVEEVFSRLKPERVSSEMAPLLQKMTRAIVDEVVAEEAPKLWETLPRFAREKVYERIEKEVPRVVQAIMEDLNGNIRQYYDVRTMVIDAFVRNKALLNELFLRCGKEEFAFIGRSGVYFGGLFGLVQMGLWIVVQPWWLLPVAGLLVGYATNWLALKMIFEPLEPQQYGPLRWHGLFLRRQKEVSAEYARLFAHEVFLPENLIQSMLKGPASDRLFLLVERHLKQAVDEASGAIGKPLLQFSLGTKRYIAIKHRISERLLQELPHSTHSLYEYTRESLDLETTLRTSLESLTPQEFETILRPIFQEDEWILITVGAVLGAVAGCLQLVLFFS